MSPSSPHRIIEARPLAATFITAIMAETSNDISRQETILHFPPESHLRETKTMDNIVYNARQATEKEHKMTLWQGIKLYPKAVFWSVLISTCIAMEGQSCPKLVLPNL